MGFAVLTRAKIRCKGMIVAEMQKTWAGWFINFAGRAVVGIIGECVGGSAGAVIDIIEWFLDDSQTAMAVVPLALKLALSGPVSICGFQPFGGKYSVRDKVESKVMGAVSNAVNSA